MMKTMCQRSEWTGHHSSTRHTYVPLFTMLSVYDDAHRAPIEYSDSDESSSDTPPVPLTPGPLDPEQCTVAGRGFSGGAAGSPLSLTVFSKDSRGIRITEGGACVSVNLIKPDTGEEVVKVEALDNKDGTYTATYTAPPRGDYKVRYFFSF